MVAPYRFGIGIAELNFHVLSTCVTLKKLAGTHYKLDEKADCKQQKGNIY
jgi:hypothetical protein